MSISIKEFAEEFTKNFTGKVEAVAIIAVSENRSAVGISGIDALGIAPRSVKLADAMQTILDTKLHVAKTLRDKMKEDGVLSSTVDGDYEKEIEEHEETSDDGVDEFIKAMSSLLGCFANELKKEVEKREADD